MLIGPIRDPRPPRWPFALTGYIPGAIRWWPLFGDAIPIDLTNTYMPKKIGNVTVSPVHDLVVPQFDNALGTAYQVQDSLANFKTLIGGSFYWTIVLWGYTRLGPTNRQAMLADWNNLGNTQAMNIEFGGWSGGGAVADEINFGYKTGGPKYVTTGVVWEAYRVYHLAFSRDNDMFYGYVDGEQKGSRFDSGGALASPSGTTQYLAVGRGGAGPGPFMDGSVWGVRIYNRLLSDAEIRSTYEPETRWAELEEYGRRTWFLPIDSGTTFYQTANVGILDTVSGGEVVTHVRSANVGITDTTSTSRAYTLFRSVNVAITNAITASRIATHYRNVAVGITNTVSVVKNVKKFVYVTITDTVSKSVLVRVAKNIAISVGAAVQQAWIVPKNIAVSILDTVSVSMVKYDGVGAVRQMWRKLRIWLGL